ncbi:hypothetical protein Trydic_g21469 [Trypoxylus dichotomus]
MKCVCGLLVLSLIAVSIEAAEWNYNNVSIWGGLCETGIYQSPINLVADDTVVDRIFSPFSFTNYDIAYPAKVKNNGHTVTITLNASNVPTITGGGLMEEYILDHFHFHWQSEHTVDNVRYPLEMHLVHYAKKYNNLTEAATYAEGVAVLGVLFELSIDDDEDFIALIEVMENVVHNTTIEVELQRHIAARSFLPRITGDYYRYTGSLTTPACNEGVIWTVFHRTLPLSADQIRHFERVWSPEGPLVLNYRPVQPLNERVIYVRNIPKRIPGGSALPNASAMCIVVLAALPVIKNYLL